MNKKFAFIISLILIVALLGGCSPWLGAQWIEHSEEATALPAQGQYWNEDLDLSLNLSNDEITIEYMNGTIEPIDIHPAGRLTNRDGTFNVWYSWNQESDEIILTIITYWEEYSEDRNYTFVRNE